MLVTTLISLFIGFAIVLYGVHMRMPSRKQGAAPRSHRPPDRTATLLDTALMYEKAKLVPLIGIMAGAAAC